MSPRSAVHAELLTIFLVRPSLTDPDRILQHREKLDHLEIRTSHGFLGSLYVRESHVGQPQWVRFFATSVNPKRIPAKSSSSAAILLIQHRKRVYAVTFGYGRNLLAPGVVDERFGLRTALNSINPDRIRSIDRRTFEAISRHSREQLSRDSSIHDFGLDVERDLLRAVTGTPLDKTLGNRLTGMDALTVSVPVTLDGLLDLLERYRELSEKADYRKQFPWVDNLSEVRDGALLDTLDRALVRQIRRSETDKVWLAPPDIIPWADIRGFTYRSAKGAKVYDDLMLESYLEDGRSTREITPDHLRSDHVNCVSASADTVVVRWTVRSCLTAEIEHDNKLFLLSDGTWFRIDQQFADDVDGVVHGIPPTTAVLQPYNDANEDAYIARIARTNRGMAVTHKKMLSVGAGRERIELCDVYTDNRILIHIKRYGPASVLSHLFAQGTVSARLLFGDPAFRRLANTIVPPTHQLADPDRPINASDFEVAFAVVQTRGKRVRLPFFSRVNLRSHYETLRALGYRVTLTLVN